MKATHQSVRETLAACGPLTSHDVASFFPESTHQAVAGILSRMRRLAVRQAYVQTWTRERQKSKEYLRPVYALGDSPDAKKPAKLTNAQCCRRWKAKQALGRGVVSSVWQLGSAC